MKKLKKYYFIFFGFLLLIMFLSPISGDDWGNYLVGQHGLRRMVGVAIGLYFSWEGRFVSRLLINFLTYYKVIWNFANSFVIVCIIYFINSICKFKNKKLMLLLSFLIILFMNIFTFSQVVVWIAGNITYLFVIPLLLIYIKLIIDNDFNKIKVAFLILLNIIIPMFVEHMALILILLNIIFSINYYLKNKKISKLLLIFLIISISSFLGMFLSPGNRIRSEMENIEFNSLSMIGKIKYNLPNFIYYTYIINYYLVFLIIVGNILLIKNNIKNKILRTILYIYEVISIIPVLNYLLSSFNITSISFLYYRNIFVIIYYIILSIINFILILRIKNINKNYLPLLFYIIGMSSNGIMLLSPTWGFRTSVGTYIFLCIYALCIIDYYFKEKKIYNYILITTNCIGILFYIIFYINIHSLYVDNYKNIKDGIKNKSDSIEIYLYPEFAPCNINPSNEYHLGKYKLYYKIDDNVELKFINGKWNFIFYKGK